MERVKQRGKVSMKTLYKILFACGALEYWYVTEVQLVAEVARLKGLNVSVSVSLGENELLKGVGV